MPRVGPTFSDAELAQITELAGRADVNPSTAVARIVRSYLNTGLAELPHLWPAAPPAAAAKAPVEPAAAPTEREPGERPAWLPPEGREARQQWIQVRGPSVEALFDRYPVELQARDAQNWPTDQLVAEAFYALSVWRDEIDAGVHPDPRIELAFRAALQDARKLLEQRQRDLALLAEKAVPDRRASSQATSE